MSFESGFFHFQIQHEGSNCFFIDDGPVFQGLPNVIEYYLTCADGLPCNLKQFCRRSQSRCVFGGYALVLEHQPPPPFQRQPTAG